MTESEQLNTLYKKFQLEKEDYFKSKQGWTIFLRKGIDKIQAKAKIVINYDPVVVEKDFVVMKATGLYKENKIDRLATRIANKLSRKK